MRWALPLAVFLLVTARTAHADLPKKSLVDIHCHVAGIGAGGSGNFVSPALLKSYKFRFYLRAFGVSRAELEQYGDGIVVDRVAERLAQSKWVHKAVILAIDGVVNAQGELDREQTEFYVDNEFIAAQVKRHNNLLFGASINPYRRDALERLERAAKQGAVLVKWLPAVQFMDPADPALVAFYRKLRDLNLPLLVHTGAENSFTHARNDLCDPARLELPLQQGVTIIAAHAAASGKTVGENNIDRLAKLMARYPNLYADISALGQVNHRGKLAYALNDKRFAGRLIYGSDFPLTAIGLLVSPYYQWSLSLAQMHRLSKIQNPWDRDVEMKQALGTPEAIFSAGADLFRKSVKSP